MPTFLLSYARDDYDLYLDDFYTRLKENVRLLVGGYLQDAGFMDRYDIELGSDWSEALAGALATCKVMVAVFSPTYFTRDACGREWAIIRQRMARYAADNGGQEPPVIIPVIWSPPSALPEDARRMQWMPPDAGATYAAEGLAYVAQRSARDDLEREYVDLVLQIAKRIKSVAENNALPDLARRPVWRDTAPAFPKAAEPAAAPVVVQRGPEAVHLVVLAGSREELAEVRSQLDYYGDNPNDWRPYLPAGTLKVSALAAGVLSNRNLVTYTAPQGSDVCEIVERAYLANSVTVIVVDGWTAALDIYREQLQKFDKSNVPTTVIMVPASAADDESVAAAETLAGFLRQALPNNCVRGDIIFRQGVATMKSFRAELARAVLEAQRRSFELAKVSMTFPDSGPADRPRLGGL